MPHVCLPELGEGIDEAVIACWHKSAGDRVTSDEDIVELVTDKATFNVSAGCNGIIKEIKFQEGQTAKVGAVLAEIEP